MAGTGRLLVPKGPRADDGPDIEAIRRQLFATPIPPMPPTRGGGPPYPTTTALGRIMRDKQITKPSNIIYDDTPIHVYMQVLHDRIIREERIAFSSMFEPGMHKSKMIGVFLAILELARHHGVVVEQSGFHGEMVLTQGETRQVLAALPLPWVLPVKLLYGSGLRLMEALRLRVKDVDFSRRELMIREARLGADHLRAVETRKAQAGLD